MIRLFFTFFFCLIVAVTHAQGVARVFTNRDSLNIYCDKIMQTLGDGKFSEAMQLFKQNSVMDIVTINNLDKTLNEQMTNILPVYKRIVGYELIEERSIKNTIVRRRYLLKFENYFLNFDFILYYNGMGWTVSNFNYKDDPKELF